MKINRKVKIEFEVLAPEFGEHGLMTRQGGLFNSKKEALELARKLQKKYYFVHVNMIKIVRIY